MSIPNMPLKDPTISVCSLVNNEESKVEDFILSILDFADEVVFADRGSSDKTLDIIKKFIKKYGQKIKLYHYNNYHSEGIHFGKAKNFAMEKATKDFIIVLDADERPSYEFKKQIKSFLRTENPDVANIVRIDSLILHLVETQQRIAKNGKKIFHGTSEEYKVHETFDHKYSVKKFNPPVWHFQKETHWLQKPEQRLFLIALEVERGKKMKSFFGHFLRAVWTFQFKFRKVYFEQEIYKDGWNGLKFSFMRGLHAFLVELFIGLKPRDGYKYWDDGVWKKKFEERKKSLGFMDN